MDLLLEKSVSLSAERASVFCSSSGASAVCYGGTEDIGVLELLYRN